MPLGLMAAASGKNAAVQKKKIYLWNERYHEKVKSLKELGVLSEDRRATIENEQKNKKMDFFISY